MTLTTTKNQYSILMKYKSNKEKNKRIDALITIILENKLHPNDIEELKKEASILAKSILRSEGYMKT